MQLKSLSRYSVSGGTGLEVAMQGVSEKFILNFFWYRAYVSFIGVE